MKRAVAIIILSLLIFSIASPAQAALVTCGLKSQDDPTTQKIEGRCEKCDLLKLFKNIIDFVTFTITPIIATLLILTSGFMLVLGGASPETITTGKKMFSGAITGVIVVYGSFMVANFFIQSLAGDDDVAKSWFKLECKDPVGVSRPDDARPDTPNTGGTTKTPLGSVTPGGFMNSMSPELAAFRTCLEGRLAPPDPNKFRITSTTDNNIAGGTCDPLDPDETFNNRNNCQHRRHSQHYGGTNPACQAKGSYALDYVGNYDAINRAAKACNANAFVLLEGSGTSNEHIHISIGNQFGCGGD